MIEFVIDTMVIICLRKISNINVRENTDPNMIDIKKNFVKKIFQFFDFYFSEKRIEKKNSIVKNITIALIFFNRFDRLFCKNTLKNYFSDEPKFMINYLMEVLQTNRINNKFTDLKDYFYFKECEIYANNNLNFPENNGNPIINSNNDNEIGIGIINYNNNSLIRNKSEDEKKISFVNSNNKKLIDDINNIIYEKTEVPGMIEIPNSFQNNNYSYSTVYTNSTKFIKQEIKETLLEISYDYTKIYQDFISKIGEPKNYLMIYKNMIIKEVIVFIQYTVLGYEKIPKINIPFSTLINHFYRIVDNSNTSIDFEILISFTRIIKKYGEQITDEWSDIFKILNIIIRRDDNKNYDKLIRHLYEILDKIKLLIVSEKFNGIIDEYLNFLDEFKSFPYDSLMILKCKYKLNNFFNYISKLESVIIENLIK
jgi:hypothetical protein